MNKPVRILATKRFEKDLRKLPSSIQKRFAQTLSELSTAPFSFELLSGEFRGLRKIRIGDYRAIYRIEDREVRTVILLLFIAHRKKVYE